MVEWIRIRRDSKKANLTKSYKRPEVVEGQNRSRHEGAQHIEELGTTLRMTVRVLKLKPMSFQAFVFDKNQ